MFRRIAPLFLSALAALAFFAAAAHADPLTVTSYDMPNGDGQAAKGTYNYWDATYDGVGHRHRDGSFLSGGTGALTDGVIATQPWDAVSNSQGTGEYVGWKDISPTITFHFGSTVTIDSITLYVDDSNVGGVTAPDAVIVNGTSHDNSNYANFFPGPEAIKLNGLDIVGNSVTITLKNQPGPWVFLSEVTFDGFVTSVPEPGNMAMLLAGLGLMGWMARRRRV